MSASDYLIAIYGIKNSEYFISYVFNDEGPIDEELLEELKRGLYGRDKCESPADGIGPFSSLEELTQFSFTICDEINADKIALYSNEEYNLLLHKVKNIKELKEKLPISGNVIENLDAEKKRGLLGKIFS